MDSSSPGDGNHSTFISQLLIRVLLMPELPTRPIIKNTIAEKLAIVHHLRAHHGTGISSANIDGVDRTVSKIC